VGTWQRGQQTGPYRNVNARSQLRQAAVTALADDRTQASLMATQEKPGHAIAHATLRGLPSPRQRRRSTAMTENGQDGRPVESVSSSLNCKTRDGKVCTNFCTESAAVLGEPKLAAGCHHLDGLVIPSGTHGWSFPHGVGIVKCTRLAGVAVRGDERKLCDGACGVHVAA
jgi:hypothetical protein